MFGNGDDGDDDVATTGGSGDGRASGVVDNGITTAGVDDATRGPDFIFGLCCLED